LLLRNKAGGRRQEAGGRRQEGRGFGLFLSFLGGGVPSVGGLLRNTLANC